jgi:hypothetical protein
MGARLLREDHVLRRKPPRTGNQGRSQLEPGSPHGQPRPLHGGSHPFRYQMLRLRQTGPLGPRVQHLCGTRYPFSARLRTNTHTRVCKKSEYTTQSHQMLKCTRCTSHTLTTLLHTSAATELPVAHTRGSRPGYRGASNWPSGSAKLRDRSH